jgi:oxalate decarboxylase
MWQTGDVTDFPFKNNIPDPLLSGKELPTFKFALEQSRGRVFGGGTFGKEVTVEQLPISKGIGGASMRLEPGVTREPHWHANSAEWAFILEGRVRTTVLDPLGRSEINDCNPGDVWYFPRGLPHSLACLGDQPCHFILIFDNGHFSEFGTLSITDWLSRASKPLLAKNFGLPEATFDGFPTEEAYFVRGSVPPEEAIPIHGVLASPPETHRYRLLAQEPHSIHKFGREWRVGPGRFPISKTITGVVLDLYPGGLRELHWHPNADEWQYVIDGQFRVTLFGSHGRYRIETLDKGDVAYIPQGYGHSVENIDSNTGRLLIGLNTGNYQTIDLSQWISSSPSYLLANVFGKSEETFAKFPKGRAFICPPDGQGQREIK